MAWLASHGKKLGLAAAGALVFLVFLGGALGGGEETLFIAVTAAEADDHASVYVEVDPGLLGSCPDEANVQITRDELIVYPSIFGKIEMDGCSGLKQVPYEDFADRNGGYVANVEAGDHTGQARFDVEKVVNWVYIRSFPNETEERTRVEVALARSQGQPIHSSVFTSGELVLDVWWEECTNQGPLGVGLGLNEAQECPADHDNVFHTTVPLNTTAVTNVIIPWDNFQSEDFEGDNPDEGYYNVTATFHNAEAKGNTDVPMDPSVFREDPPGNWFEVSYE